MTLNTPLKAAGAEYWDLSAHEGKAGMRYHMKGGDTHFYKLRAAKELPGQRLAVVFSSRESSAANPSLERDEDGNVVASPAEELGIQWGHDADGYVGTDGTDASAADEPHEEHADEHGASLLPPGLERLGGGRNALAFSVSQLEQKMGGKKIPGGYSRFTMVATPGARRPVAPVHLARRPHPATHASDAAAAAAPRSQGATASCSSATAPASSATARGLERQTTAVATPTDFRNRRRRHRQQGPRSARPSRRTRRRGTRRRRRGAATPSPAASGRRSAPRPPTARTRSFSTNCEAARSEETAERQ